MPQLEDELKLVQEKAFDILKGPDQSPEKISMGLNLLKNVEEIKKCRADTAQLRGELSKNRFVQYMNILAPYATVLVLVGTLCFQFWQQNKMEKDRNQDRDDARWADALKSVSEGKDAMTAIIQLKTFTKSPWHKQDAFHLVLSLFGRSKNLEDFRPLFETQFTPVSGDNLDEILDVDRTLHVQWIDLNRNGENPEMQYQIIRKLSYICTQIAPVLQQRSPDKSFDLHFVAVFDCDLSWVDLTNANLKGFVSGRVRLSNASLSGIESFKSGYWNDTVWWEARDISPGLLAYLQLAAPFKANPPGHYGRIDLTQEQYDQTIKKL